MAYNKRVLFPTDPPTITIKDTSEIVTSSITYDSRLDVAITASNEFINGSAKIYFRPTGSGTLIASSSYINITSSTQTTGTVNLTDIPSSVRNLSVEQVYEISANFLGTVQRSISNKENFSNITVAAVSPDTTPVIYNDGTNTYKVFRFTSSGTIQFFTPTQCDVLIVGGGGGGGCSLAGGGGGGNVAYGTNLTLSDQYTVEVGAGGVGAANTSVLGSPGTTSYLQNPQFTQTTLGGGGGESRYSSEPSDSYGNGGGSEDGGGGGIGNLDTAQTGFTVYGGNNGGNGNNNSDNYPGGGGGGAGANGATPANNTAQGGNGGIGVQVGTVYDGVNNYYWAGGGGGSSYIGSAGGGNGGSGGGGGGSANTGTGGTGGSGLNPGGNGISGNDNSNADDDGGPGGANTGGGGGASSHEGSNSLGRGGSGIVLIRYVV